VGVGGGGGGVVVVVMVVVVLVPLAGWGRGAAVEILTVGTCLQQHLSLGVGAWAGFTR